MSQLPRYQSYKDSGVQWLGEIPSHWQVKKLNYVINAIGDVDHYMPESQDVGIPYVMTGDLKELVSQIDLKSCKQVGYDDYVKLSKKIKSQKGDLILARYATIGTVSYVDVDIELLFSYSCVTIKANYEKLLGLYLFHYFKSKTFFEEVQIQINANTQANVGIENLKKVKIVIPPLDEQKIIADFLDKRLAQVDSLITKQETLLEKLAEQRVALISHAVTKGLNPDVEMKDSGIDYLGKIPKNWKVVKLSRVFSIKAGGDVQEDKFSRECSEDYPYPIYTNANDAKSIYGYTNEARYPNNSITVSGRGEVGFAVYRDHSFDAIIRLLVMMPYQEVDCRYYTYLINAVIDFQVNSSAVNQLSTLQIAPYKVPLFSGSDQKKIADYLDVECGKIDGMTQVVEKTISKLQEYRSTLITQVVTGKIDVRNHKVN